MNLYKYLTEDKKEYALSKQMLRSGTSIGANVRERLNAESPTDFIHIMSNFAKKANNVLIRINKGNRIFN